MDKKLSDTATHKMCRRKRLVAGSIAAVDICTSCGCMELKLGNISLRFSPNEMGELVGTLAEAIARYNAIIASPQQMGPAVPWPGAGRGQA